MFSVQVRCARKPLTWWKSLSRCFRKKDIYEKNTGPGIFEACGFGCRRLGPHIARRPLHDSTICRGKARIREGLSTFGADFLGSFQAEAREQGPQGAEVEGQTACWWRFLLALLRKKAGFFRFDRCRLCLNVSRIEGPRFVSWSKATVAFLGDRFQI